MLKNKPQSNIVIRSAKSVKTIQEDRMNAPFTQEGRRERKEAVDLQKNVQGGLSDLVREHGYIPDKVAEEYFTGIQEQAPKDPNRRKPSTTKTYMRINGKLVRVK